MHTTVSIIKMCLISLSVLLTTTDVQSKQNGSYPTELSTELTHIFDSLTNHSQKKVYTIILDPGHGGKDHGCSGHSSKEKTIVLQIAKKLKKELNQDYPFVKVVLTRDQDKFIPLHKRAQIANAAKADLFISIHCNAVPGKHHVHGSETYVLGLNRAEDQLEVAKRENEVILLEENYQQSYDGFDPNSAEGHIVLSMFQNAFLEQSITFAHHVENNFKKIAKRKSRGVKQAGFLVLRETTMPAVLIESGFLTHSQEEEFLLSDEGQALIVRSIFKAIESYAQLEQKQIQEEKSEENQSINTFDYAVQLLSLSHALEKKHQVYIDFENLVVIQDGSVYKYLIPGGNSKSEAKQAQLLAIEKGYKDAFITLMKAK